MMVWRYKAIDPRKRSGPNIGELAAESPAEVRASLRRIGLQVIDVRPARRPSASLQLPAIAQPVRDLWQQHLRGRRKLQRADLYDGLATMLDSGLPLLEAISTMHGEGTGRGALSRFGSPRHMMLAHLRESLRGGNALDEAMASHPSWFDQAELAMVRAGQHNGDLPGVLRNLAERHQRSGALTQKLVAALTYPTVIAVVGLAVVVFLSVKTLPDLTSILRQADLPIPVLTQRVMSFGQAIAQWWWLGLLILFLLTAIAIFVPSLLQRSRGRSGQLSKSSDETSSTWTLVPKVLRRIGVAQVSLRLAELIRTGVPMVDALRVLAPTVGNRSLSVMLYRAADRVEQGDELPEALNDPRWFDLEYRRLLGVGQATGELDALLERIGLRYQRQAERLIDRLAALLEPVVLLSLAALIGVVVMAAILPLIRLQEVLG